MKQEVGKHGARMNRDKKSKNMRKHNCAFTLTKLYSDVRAIRMVKERELR